MMYWQNNNFSFRKEDGLDYIEPRVFDLPVPTRTRPEPQSDMPGLVNAFRATPEEAQIIKGVP